MEERWNWINSETMIPELLQRAPQVRPVLDRYGLHGCGGALGPAEPLHFFALAHDVPLEQLLDEIQAALAAPPPPAAAPEAEAHSLAAAAPSPADTIYLPFFKGGIGVVLTLGAVWGAFLLLRIALFGSFTAIGVHEVNAHGHAQIFGWVGLFVMGFAYQAFPRFKHTTLAWPALARQTFWWMLTGIVARAVLEPLHWLGPWAAKIAVGGGMLETAAIAVFALIIIQTLRRSGKPLAHYDYYVLAALFFFLVQSVYETAYCAATLRARTLPELLPLVVVFQSPLRDLQIHGFAMLMILGVSQRIFHYFYGFRAPNPRLSMACLVLLVPAILGEAGGMLLMRWDGPEWSPLWFGSAVLIFITTAFLVGSWHIFSRPAEAPDRSLKFLRTAYVWLFIALAMLVALPFYQSRLLPMLAPASEAAQMGFSHAFSGAMRHAITVGFISLMIMGVAARVVPTLKGVDVRTQPALWAPFILINLGCALRVTGQVLTDFFPAAYPAAGMSGLLEVLALALWGTHLLQIMARREGEPARGGAEEEVRLTPQTLIQPAHRVSDVLEACPWLMETFVQFGFTPLANPALRATLAKGVSIRMACRIHQTDVDCFIDALNSARVAGQSGQVHA